MQFKVSLGGERDREGGKREIETEKRKKERKKGRKKGRKEEGKDKTKYNIKEKRTNERRKERQRASWMPHDMITAGKKAPQVEFLSSVLPIL